MRTNLPPKAEFSRLVKEGMKKAKKNGVHIGRPPRLLQRSHKGTLYMRKDVKKILEQFKLMAPCYRKDYERELLLDLWYRNKHRGKSVPAITVDDLKIVLKRTKYKKFVKQYSNNQKTLDRLFEGGPSYNFGKD